MAQLAKDRNTIQRPGDEFSRPVAASTKIFAGSLVALNAAGDAVPGSTSTTLKADGRAEEFVDNSNGSAGDAIVKIRKGTFHFDNDGSVTRANIGTDGFIVDDQTIAATDGTETRSVAGVIVDVDADGVWVRIN